MNQCPECEYLVPSAWEQCRRCGASLVAATAVVPVGVPSSTKISRPRPDLAPRPPLSNAGQPPPIAAAYTPPPREGAGAPRRRRALARIPVVGPVCVMVVVASLWVGWQKYLHPPVPVALRPWIQDHGGVVYRPAGTALRVSLPAVPTETSARVTFGPGLEGVARVARSKAGSHEIEVVWLVAPGRSLNKPGVDPIVAAADFAARAGGFRVLVPTQTQHLQRPALEAAIERSGHDGRALIVLDGTAIYAVVVSGPDAPEAGFDFLVRSLELGSLR